VSAHHGIGRKFTKVLNTAGIMYQRDSYLIDGHVSEGLVWTEVADPQITQSYKPERMAVNVQYGRFIPQNRDSSGLHAVYQTTQQVLPPAVRQTPNTIIMITQTGINAEPAFDVAKQIDHLLPVPASKIICNVIPRQHHYIDIEKINPLKTTTQIPAAHGPAMMNVADMYYPRSMQGPMRTLQFQINFNHFNPLRPYSVSINRPASAETQST
jgi:hypothetical protein